MDLDATPESRERDVGDVEPPTKKQRTSSLDSVSDLFSDSLTSVRTPGRRRNLSLKKHSVWTFTPVSSERKRNIMCPQLIDNTNIRERTSTPKHETGQVVHKVEVLEAKLKNLERIIENKNTEIESLTKDKLSLQKELTAGFEQRESKITELNEKINVLNREHAEEKGKIIIELESEREDQRWKENLYERERVQFETNEQELKDKINTLEMELKGKSVDPGYRPKYAELLQSKEKYKADAHRFFNENTELKKSLKKYKKEEERRRTSILHILIEKGSGKIIRTPMVENLEIDCTQQVCAPETEMQVCRHLPVMHTSDISVHRSHVTYV